MDVGDMVPPVAVVDQPSVPQGTVAPLPERQVAITSVPSCGMKLAPWPSSASEQLAGVPDVEEFVMLMAKLATRLQFAVLPVQFGNEETDDICTVSVCIPIAAGAFTLPEKTCVAPAAIVVGSAGDVIESAENPLGCTIEIELTFTESPLFFTVRLKL